MPDAGEQSDLMEGGDEPDDWRALAVARAPMLLEWVESLLAESVPVDPEYVMNLRALVAISRLGDVQRARLTAHSEWPIRLVGGAAARPRVAVPGSPPRFQGEAAHVLLRLLRRAAEMSDGEPTLGSHRAGSVK